jgi:hypothetical protein
VTKQKYRLTLGTAVDILLEETCLAVAALIIYVIIRLELRQQGELLYDRPLYLELEPLEAESLNLLDHVSQLLRFLLLLGGDEGYLDLKTPRGITLDSVRGILDEIHPPAYGQGKCLLIS